MHGGLTHARRRPPYHWNNSRTSPEAIPQKRIWQRVQAVVLAKQGRTATDIAHALGCSLQAVKNWVAQYNRGGIEALHERPRHRTAAAAWPRSTTPGSKQRLDAPPRPEDGVCTLRGADVRRILEREFGVPMGLQAVYDLLHRLGYSGLMPRPQHEDANPEVQEFFKEIVVEQIDAIAAEHPGSGGAGLLRGRGAVRHAGDDHAGLGPQGVAAPGGAAERPRVAVRADGRLRRHGGGLGADHAGVEHRGGQPVPGAVLAASCPPGSTRC